ncbi:zinc metalloprotease [Larkinella soli]|uniref:zinc metalloprotease n=1 Tax=Larkinella soli TaxID=1770527 RepID=UPI0013E3DACB|nr:zinc metalloprotease [Larkinella soli]
MPGFLNTVQTMARGLLVWVTLSQCRQDRTIPASDPASAEIIRIPVVVHVLYSRIDFNVSDAKITSQIVVLNQDFRNRNPDRSRIPEEFAGLAADTGIEFELAKVDPQGHPTTGITRTFSPVDGFAGRDLTGRVPVEDLPLYFTGKGGHDAWPTDRYLNIWVAELSDREGNLALAGYAHFPGSDARIDGVVIDPRVFGTLPPLASEHSGGRTATHEIGHWLNLLHLYDGTGQCRDADLVPDTPPTSEPYTGTPSYPQQSCGTGSMFMNFMELVDDGAMHLFTKGQRDRMRAVFAPAGGRHALYRSVRAAGN